MKRLAAGAGFTGLGLMSVVALFLCRSSALDLESKLLLFLFGIGLFVVGGSGYAATQRPVADQAAGRHSADASSASVRNRVAGA